MNTRNAKVSANAISETGKAGGYGWALASSGGSGNRVFSGNCISASNVAFLEDAGNVNNGASQCSKLDTPNTSSSMMSFKDVPYTTKKASILHSAASAP